MSWQETFYNATKVSICIVHTDYRIEALYPEDFSGFYTEDVLSSCLHAFALRRKDLFHPLCMTLEPTFYLGIAQLSADCYVILGPAVPYYHSFDEIVERTRKKWYAKDQDRLAEMLIKAPIQKLDQFANVLALAIFLGSGRLLDVRSIVYEERIETLSAEHPESSLAAYTFHAQENAVFHHPGRQELLICRAIEEGNLPAMERALGTPVSGRRGILSLDPDRQNKYIFVTAVAIFSRAGVRGGIPFETAYSTADVYCQRADLMSDPGDIEVLMWDAARYFCRLVQDLKGRKAYSNVVRVCCDYIETHLHEKIVLRDLVPVVHVSPQTISSKMKKETGMSVVDYINRSKMREARNLLLYTDYSISEISNYLCYSNQSYFGRIFQEYYHTTPGKYRDGADAPDTGAKEEKKG